MRVHMMTGEGMAMGRLMKQGCLAVVALFCGGFLWAEGIEQSVVKIVNQYNMFNWYSPWDSGSTGKGTGSGFVISKNRIRQKSYGQLEYQLRRWVLYAVFSLLKMVKNN